MKKTYFTHGTCCKAFDIEIEDGRIRNVDFYGGCNGNLQGICSLIKGMKIELTALKNTLIKSNQYKAEYTSYIEEQRQMRQLGIIHDDE